MIALDTNVLVRHLTDDEPDQGEAAGVLLSGLSDEKPGFVSREVAVELAWVLSRSYGLGRVRVAEIFEMLLDTRGLAFESAEEVGRAAANYRRGGPDFADWMILLAAERAGALPLFSFDRRVARLPGAAIVPGQEP